MRNAGLIDVHTQSLWLINIDSRGGLILFRAVDSAKYTGSLQTVPIVATVASIVTTVASSTAPNLG